MREENMNIESDPRNQHTSTNENSEYSTFVGWVKKHKKGILIAGGAIVAIGAGCVVYKNWDSITNIFKTIKPEPIVINNSSVSVKVAMPVFLCGNRKSHGILRHCYWRISDQAVKAKTGDMQNIGRRKVNLSVFALRGSILRILLVQIKKPAVFITVDCHFVGHQRVEGNNLTSCVPDNLRISVAPQ